ncbi:MAG: lipoate--protein ligase [Oscillospiraceae bacterium]|jgi:lipoate-protein ligase A|nr:lipoate--protein ligase [Oscillospiraceae bacterium]
MIKKLSVVRGGGTVPYDNLAAEKRLFDTVGEDEVIMYLWQNRRTVVCGRNQNMYKECRVSKLLEDKGFPARRLSGGGAVFHDLGNLNFTFIAHDGNFSIDRQLSVIVRACAALGIAAEKTGRNDVTVDMKKFSGNAFHSSAGRRYHHGTLMIDVDVGALETYLNVDREKLRSKGVDSVRSRVCNLSQYRPGLTAEELSGALIAAFEDTYALKSSERGLPPPEELEELRAFFASDEWLYGTVGVFDIRISRRFAWGDFDLRLNVSEGGITSAELYSDANDAGYILSLSKSLPGRRFDASDIGALAAALAVSEEQRVMAGDITELMKSEL